MKVTLFGASGMIGSRILAELVRRGHTVTAVARHPEKIVAAGATAEQGDITDQASVAAAAKGADAVVSAYAPPQANPELVLAATHALLAGLKAAGVKRLIVVGGAGSLEVAPGLQLVDAPNFPEAWKPIALAHRDVVPVLEASDAEWSYQSPAAFIQPGERTGKARVGGRQLVTDAKGESRISAEDFAVVLVDELEKPQHVRQQFTAAY